MPAWTPNTLKDQILGELNQSRDALGTATDRLGNIVEEAYQTLWGMHDWVFRRRRDTLTTTADTATVSMPSDFQKLDAQWVRESDGDGTLVWTDRTNTFETYRNHDPDATGVPKLAMIEPDTSGSSFAMAVRLAPTPDGVYEYTIVYLCNAPTLTGTDEAMFPEPFHRLWHDLALFRSQRAFGRKDWRETYAAFREGLTRAIEVNDETLQSSTPLIEDEYGDLRATTRAIWENGTFL